MIELALVQAHNTRELLNAGQFVTIVHGNLLV
jgi:hypothetical protein